LKVAEQFLAMPLNLDLNAPQAPEQSILIFNKILTKWPLRREFIIPSEVKVEVDRQITAQGKIVPIIIENYNGDVTREVKLRRPPKRPDREERAYRFGEGWRQVVRDHRMEVGGTVWLYGRQGDDNRLILYYEPPPSKYIAETPATVAKKQKVQFKGKQQKLDDGYQWQSYGNNHRNKEKNSFRSYYKCRREHCKAKVKVDRNVDGKITNVEYMVSHNHPMAEESATANTLDNVALVPDSNREEAMEEHVDKSASGSNTVRRHRSAR
jgi:hypothetical protein